MSLTTLYGQAKDAGQELQNLIKTLHEGNVDERQRAAIALGYEGNKDAVEPLLKALDDEDDFVRDFAVKALGNIGDSSALAPLMKALDDSNILVQRSAATALGNLKDPKAFDPLMNALKTGPYMVRRSAAIALGTLGDPRAVDSLIEALGDEDVYIKDAAVSGLTKLGVQAIPKLVAALGNWTIGPGAAEVLGNLGWKASSDEDKVRFEVATRSTQSLLDGWGVTKSVLLSDAKSENGPLALNAVFALIGIGREEVLNDLVTILNNNGSADMAQAFLHSGNDSLAQAAQEWTKTHGAEKTEGEGASISIGWGEMKVSQIAADTIDTI
jgi:HEAT repeat protein